MIAIGHSLGALRLLRQPPPGCAGLVCINGFARFGAGPDFPEGVAPRLLDRMLRSSSPSPGGAARFPRALRRRHAIRRADMAALERACWRCATRRAGLAALPMPALALAGAEDPVVPPAMTGAALPVALRWHARGHCCRDRTPVVRRTHPRLRARPGRHRSLT